MPFNFGTSHLLLLAHRHPLVAALFRVGDFRLGVTKSAFPWEREYRTPPSGSSESKENCVKKPRVPPAVPKECTPRSSPPNQRPRVQPILEALPLRILEVIVRAACDRAPRGVFAGQTFLARTLVVGPCAFLPFVEPKSSHVQNLTPVSNKLNNAQRCL